MGFLSRDKDEPQLPPVPKASTPIIDQVGTSPEDERARNLKKAAQRRGYRQSLIAGRRAGQQTLGASGAGNGAREGLSLLGGR